MLILTADEVRKALPMKEAIQAMKAAYASVSNGQAVAPLRTRLPIPGSEALSLFMPAFVQSQDSNALAVKVVSLFPTNPSRGLAYIQAAVLVFDPETGQTVGDPTNPSFAVDRSTGNLYAVWEDGRFSNFQYNDVAFSMSADGGLSWSNPIRVNQTPLNIPASSRQAFFLLRSCDTWLFGLSRSPKTTSGAVQRTRFRSRGSLAGRVT